MTWRSPRLLKAVRALPCQNCGADDGSVVAAHDNRGKGMGIKASDATVMALCFSCHTTYDQGKDMTREERHLFANEMRAKTAQALLETGMVVVR